MAGGFGAGSGVRLDLHVEIGVEIGRVSISVILVPFPGILRPEPAERLVPASNWLPNRRFPSPPASWG
jgi:hypothetical protein